MFETVSWEPRGPTGLTLAAASLDEFLQIWFPSVFHQVLNPSRNLSEIPLLQLRRF